LVRSIERKILRDDGEAEDSRMAEKARRHARLARHRRPESQLQGPRRLSHRHHQGKFVAPRVSAATPTRQSQRPVQRPKQRATLGALYVPEYFMLENGVRVLAVGNRAATYGRYGRTRSRKSVSAFHPLYRPSGRGV
jgi:hypothetical protein